ncbi:MAG: hypothetical protein IJ379_10220 [Lachnospiraceae bacterium]|nr:hypothetical protein [Lachnospiraceae bacterium]
MGKKSVKKSTKTSSVIFVIIAFAIVVVAGYYCYLVRRPAEETADKELTPVQEILLKDISISYPPTVKEVVKYYNEITKCLYNEECSQEDLEALIQQERELFDEALLANNDWGSHVITLSGEVLAFKESGRKLTGCAVGASTDVDYFEADGYSFARIPCNYTVMQGAEYTTTMHIFLLRKDAQNHWKIYGWDVADNVNLNATAEEK